MRMNSEEIGAEWEAGGRTRMRSKIMLKVFIMGSELPINHAGGGGGGGGERRR